MGRGRQRAKQRKVARNLKYFSPETDYDALARELSGNSDNFDSYSADDYEVDDDYDAYAEYAAKYDSIDDIEEDEAEN